MNNDNDLIKTIAFRVTSKDFWLFKKFLKETEQTQTEILREFLKSEILKKHNTNNLKK